jgi:1-acyl-sn-glycerol-3-phosphate acyltransferase
LYYFVGYILKGLFNILVGIKVYNKKHLPQSGAYVLACTHTGWVDVLWLGIALLPIKIHYMAKKQLFENKLIGWFLRKLNAFPVDRDHPGPSVLKIPYKLLSEGKVVGIFPSGTRKSEQTTLKHGAIKIAQRSKVPIIPTVYIGPDNLKELILGKKARLIFGKPIHITTIDRNTKDYFTNLLEQSFEELKKELQNVS